MELTRVEAGGVTFLEGTPHERFMNTAQDVDRLIEVCFGERVQAALLYGSNVPPTFFDLSSGEAGSILQKLRAYHIRLALVNPADGVPLSSRFGDLLADERRGNYFGLFETREKAVAWLGQP